jgi:hypothetical protein
MARPYGSKNIPIPEPPFEFSLGSSKIVIEAKIDKDNEWLFPITLDGKKVCSWSLEELQDFVFGIRAATRYPEKVERERSKLSAKISKMEEELAFLKR